MPTVPELITVWRRSQDLVGRLRKLFVIGCPKSGTTWIQNQLAGHPEIVIHGEGRFAWRMFPAISKGFQAFNADQSQFVPDPAKHLGDVDLLMCMRQLVAMQLFLYIERSSVTRKDMGRVRVVGAR